MAAGVVFLVGGLLCFPCAYTLRGLWGCVIGVFLGVVMVAAGVGQIVGVA